MSLEARQYVADHLVFQDATQKSDLLNENIIKTETIGLLQYILEAGFFIEVTALKSDHHDDHLLGAPPDFQGTHNMGWAVDCWPLNSNKPGDYTDESTHEFRAFLLKAAEYRCIKQIGLAGAANLPQNEAILGGLYFADDGGDHIHFGTKSA